MRVGHGLRRCLHLPARSREMRPMSLAARGVPGWCVWGQIGITPVGRALFGIAGDLG